MDSTYDLVIRGGSVADGRGGAPAEADIAIASGRIAATGEIAGKGREEIDAKGRLVTPGFVDIHTHYDGQATWDSHLAPSSWHGVTTVVMGNCGVGFAPVRRADRDRLIELMEGVEDIPGVALHEGLSWNWESFGTISTHSKPASAISTSVRSFRMAPCASMSWVNAAPNSNRRRKTTSRRCAA